MDLHSANLPAFLGSLIDFIIRPFLFIYNTLLGNSHNTIELGIPRGCTGTSSAVSPTTLSVRWTTDAGRDWRPRDGTLALTGHLQRPARPVVAERGCRKQSHPIRRPPPQVELTPRAALVRTRLCGTARVVGRGERPAANCFACDACFVRVATGCLFVLPPSSLSHTRSIATSPPRSGSGVGVATPESTARPGTGSAERKERGSLSDSEALLSVPSTPESLRRISALSRRYVCCPVTHLTAAD
jgi:hypothetical protein